MQTIEIKEGDKVIEKIKLPQKASETKLNQFIDILASYESHQKFYDDLKDGEIENNPANKLQKAIYQAEEVAEFTGSQNIFGNHVASIGGQDVEATLEFTSMLNTSIWGVLSAYEPKLKYDEDYIFTHRGEKFTCKAVYRDVLLNTVEFESLKTGEGIEMMEVFRKMESAKGNDMTGSLRYTSYLTMLAVLARKEKEKFPTSKDEIEKFIKKRINFFGGVNNGKQVNSLIVSYTTAMDVFFWATNYYNHLKKKPI